MCYLHSSKTVQDELLYPLSLLDIEGVTLTLNLVMFIVYNILVPTGQGQ